MSLRGDLAGRNISSKKDQDFDLLCKGWILQTALQGAFTNLIPLILFSLCFICQDKILLFAVSIFTPEKNSSFQGLENLEGFCLSIPLLFQLNVLLQWPGGAQSFLQHV